PRHREIARARAAQALQLAEGVGVVRRAAPVAALPLREREPPPARQALARAPFVLVQQDDRLAGRDARGDLLDGTGDAVEPGAAAEVLRARREAAGGAEAVHHLADVVVELKAALQALLEAPGRVSVRAVDPVAALRLREPPHLAPERGQLQQ